MSKGEVQNIRGDYLSNLGPRGACYEVSNSAGTLCSLTEDLVREGS